MAAPVEQVGAGRVHRVGIGLEGLLLELACRRPSAVSSTGSAGQGQCRTSGGQSTRGKPRRVAPVPGGAELEREALLQLTLGHGPKHWHGELLQERELVARGWQRRQSPRWPELPWAPSAGTVWSPSAAAHEMSSFHVAPIDSVTVQQPDYLGRRQQEGADPEVRVELRSTTWPGIARSPMGCT